MPKTLLVFGWVACSFLAVSLFDTASIAHQTVKTSDVEAMIHLDPNDQPYAGKSTLTWAMLTRRGGEMISPAKCNCRMVAYDSQNRAIARNLPLSSMQMEGHKQGHEAIRTTIKFPKPGAYTVVLTGQAKDKSFAPFEFKVPVTVRP